MPTSTAARRRASQCEDHFVDEDKIRRVQRAMVSDDLIGVMVEAFRALSDPTRVKIIFALSKEELCVCDLARLLGATDSAVSHQLRLLRSQRLVKYRREGKMVYYSLDDDHIRTLFSQGLEHARCHAAG